jgi:hypothetical protein
MQAIRNRIIEQRIAELEAENAELKTRDAKLEQDPKTEN